ncbi:transcription factor HES-2-like [Electrophorus electricus]|uniref:BHLH domain-containing protein n=1 Tax=Electrophorus electricus TaxID=8005 RepID=A0A4W4E995_ELEEL|nr:transcription factor HES-2-like [Electrophorus electricus]
MRKEATELRKTLKPLMEKRRRARINDSLNQLKTLILPLIGKDNCRYSKLEKADILEMTVRFLTNIPSSPTKDTTLSFKEGYKACLQCVSALLPQINLDRETRQRVNQFIQQSTVSAAPGCQNCCAHSSRPFPQIHQQLLSLKSNIHRNENHAAVNRPSADRPQPQVVGATMWRPWLTPERDSVPL